ncbi:MAG: hypothetical protein AAB436_01175 [Patescibacteria group bacterium]
MIRRTLLSVALMMMCFFATPITASAAYDVFNGVDCTDVANQTSAVCSSKTDTDPISGSDGVIARITNIVAIVAGAAAIIVVIVSGMRLTTSGGDAAKVATARNGIINALIGILIIVIARLLIFFILKRI